MGLLQGFGQDWMQQDLFGLAKGWGAGAGVIVGGEGKGRDEDFRMDSVRHLGVECAFGLYAYMRRCIHAHIHTRTHTYLHAFAFTQTPCLSVFVFLSLPPSHPPLFCSCLCVSLFVFSLSNSPSLPSSLSLSPPLSLRGQRVGSGSLFSRAPVRYAPPLIPSLVKRAVRLAAWALERGRVGEGFQ